MTPNTSKVVRKISQEPWGYIFFFSCKGLADKNAWLHMDTLEPAKLEWIQTLSTSSSLPPSHQSTQVRFDFNGSIVPKDADVATREGLHHHGENPEVNRARVFTLSLSIRTHRQLGTL